MDDLARRRRWRRGALLLATAALVSGCMFRALRRDLRELGTFGVLRGTVSVDQPSDAAVVVMVYSGEAGAVHVFDSFVLARPGSYYFIVPAGSYRLAAFEDRDE